MSLLASNRNFRLLFSASAISNLGDGVSALAFPWLATLITKDPTLIALVAAATRLPWLLFALPAGVLTDRADRRRLMIMADLLRLLLTAGVIALIVSLPALPLSGEPTLYIAGLCGLAFLLGTAEVVRDNAAQTALPSIVSSSNLERANGQLWSVEQIMGSFVGPPLAGVLIAYAVPAPFALDAITFGLAAWAVWMIAVPPRVAPIRKPIRTEIRDAFTYLWSNISLRRLALMLGVINAIATASLTVLVLISQEVLGLNGLWHGVLLTAGAAGGVVGGLVCPAIAARLGAQRSIMLSLMLFPIPFLMIALTSSVTVVAIALFAEMFVALLWNVVTVSYRQRLIPDDMLGRVNSIYRFFAWGLMPVGALLGGWVVSFAEPDVGREAALRLPYFIGFGVSIALAAYGLLRLRLNPT
ncbi:MAG: MFS transporter [Pseudomonadota bacterium]